MSENMKMTEESTAWSLGTKSDNVNDHSDETNKKKEESSNDESSSDESGSDSDSGSNSDSSSSSKASNSSSGSGGSKKSASSSRSSASDDKDKRSPPSIATSEVNDSKSKADDFSDTNDTSMDFDSSSNQKSRSSKKPSRDLKEMIDTNPDMYGVRRSARCRKEPERYTTVDADSDGSEKSTSKKSNLDRTRQRRKDSGDWDATDGSASDRSDQPKQRLARRPAARSSKSNSSSKRRQRIKEANGSSETESDSDDDKRGSSRRTNAKKVSYKEQSDHTDSEDLVDVDWGDYNPEADVGETIEKVLEQRLGRKGATGLLTTAYNVENNGDPNVNSDKNTEKEVQFLIKWKGKSYLHTTWETDETLATMNAKGLKKIENFLRREEEIKQWKDYATPEDIEYYDCQEEMAYQLRQLYFNVERIIAHQPSKSTDTCHPEYLCKFEGLPYSECTFEEGTLISKKYSKKIDEYHTRQKSLKTPSKLCRALKVRPKFVQLKTQPEYIGSEDTYVLRDYQLDGLNWLAHTWCKQNSVILADEMGLGKTIQTISYFSYLFNHHQVFGPFLMVVPLSTMAAWQKEFEQWAPELNLVVYIGDVGSRNMIRSYEWCHAGNKRLKFNVLLTTYEILLKDKGFLGSVPWAVLGIDEAHRLKNDDSLLYKTLIDFDTNHRILITGTPLQNSLRELWALLHFIMPEKFASWEDFEAEHGDADAKGYAKLHRQLEPFLLRRVKKDVEKSLPAKVEQILRVEMTQVQKQYYKWILTKNYRALAKGLKGSLNGFANIMMELKKCCNHATLIRQVDDLNHLDPLTRVIRGSGKLLLLDKLLCRLKETGHRVLIFSQMVRMLDILSDYLSLRRFAFQRLDGTIKGEIRKQALDHFNAEGSQDFCFLLSTRAGGLGINLATADTVIIFDSDWNPQNDLQAQARAHRIGQKNQVNIYRLVTKGSVEEDILERAKQKMVLDHLVIQRMDTTGKTVLSKGGPNSSSSNGSTPFNKEELAQILKFGAQELFKEGEDGDEEEPHVDIDDILKRAETREDGPPSTGNSELLSAFKMASFNFNEEEVTAIPDVKKDWDDIIPQVDRDKIAAEEKAKEELEMFLPPRSRKTAQQQAAEGDSGEEFDPNAARDKGDGSEDSDVDKPRGRKGKKGSCNREALKGFTEQEVRRFVKSFKKFAAPLKRLDSISIDAELQDKSIADLKGLAESLQTTCENSIKEYQDKLAKEGEEGQAVKKKGDRGPNFKFFGVTVFPKNLLGCQQELEPLEFTLPPSAEERKKWVLTTARIKDVKDWDVSWTVEDDSRLLVAVHEYGMGSWEAIKMDPTYNLSEKILPDGELKPQGKQLQTRTEYLLRMIHKVLVAQKIQKEVKKPKKKTKANDPSNGESSKSSKEKSKKEKKGEKSEEGKKKKKKTSTKKDGTIEKVKDKKKKGREQPAMHFTANAEPQIIDADMDPEMFKLCKEKMRPVKKVLKQLDKTNSEKISEEQKTRLISECLLKIGNRIKECLDQCMDDLQKAREMRSQLWTFVSKFTDHSPKRVFKMWKQAVKNSGEPRSRKSKSSHRDSSRHRSPQNQSYRSFTPEDEHFGPQGAKRPKNFSDGMSPSKRMRETSLDRPHASSSGMTPRGGEKGWVGPQHLGRGDDRSSDRYKHQPYPKQIQQEKFRGRGGYDRPPPAPGMYPPQGSYGPSSYSSHYSPSTGPYSGPPGGAPFTPQPGQPHAYPPHRGDGWRRPDANNSRSYDNEEMKNVPTGHAGK